MFAVVFVFFFMLENVAQVRGDRFLEDKHIQLWCALRINLAREKEY